MRKVLFFLIIFCANYINAQVSCSMTYERTLQNFNVYIHDSSGATMYRAKMYIDADGSPRAYGPNNSGLDYTANAGYTGNWWGVVADASGQNPILQGAGDPFPGMYVSTTSLVDANYSISNPLRYVNSETVPFIAMPTNVLADGDIHVGDVAFVYNTTTGQYCFAIYADAGNTTSIGEGSIYLASQIGVDPDVRTGGTSLGIIDYVVFPHSGFGQGYIPTITQIDSIGNEYLATVGGLCIVSCLGPVFDNTPPTTAITAPAQWDTTSFTATFTDADNSCSGIIAKSFYNVSELNAQGEWRSNNSNGFFADAFDGTSIHPDWTTATGTWSMNSNYLQETDENLGNTNIYAPLTQNLADCYLYSWTASIGGIGSNRRAGFHFFADQPDSSNRGNSYFVWFRLDDDKIQIYKSVNNSWGSGPVKDTAYDFNANQLYDFKVMYDRVTGLIRVYVNGVASAQWVDSAPFTNGGYVSFRSANCNYHVDNFTVYHSRTAQELIPVGSSPVNDIRFEDQNPATPSGKVRSIIVDASRNLSSDVAQTVNIDFTPPSLCTVYDGNAQDIDTTTVGTQLEANWTASVDTNSDVTAYYFAVGTTPGASNVVGWTNNGMNTAVTVSNLVLMNQQMYFVSVQSENGAGMRSGIAVSDGQVYNDISLGVPTATSNNAISVYPNPSAGSFTVELSSTVPSDYTVSIYDENGKLVEAKSIYVNGSQKVDFVSTLARGNYLIEAVATNGDRKVTRLVVR